MLSFWHQYIWPVLDPKQSTSGQSQKEHSFGKVDCSEGVSFELRVNCGIIILLFEFGCLIWYDCLYALFVLAVLEQLVDQTDAVSSETICVGHNVWFQRCPRKSLVRACPDSLIYISCFAVEIPYSSKMYSENAGGASSITVQCLSAAACAICLRLFPLAAAHLNIFESDIHPWASNAQSKACTTGWLEGVESWCWVLTRCEIT